MTVKIGDKEFPTRDFVSGMVRQEKDSFTPEQFEEIKAEHHRVAAMMRDLIKQKKHDFLDFSFFDRTKAFCKVEAQQQQTHFMHKSDFFDRKISQLDEAKRYKFQDDFVQLHIEKSKSDLIDKNMPFRNMWLEAKFEVDGILITGIHLMRIHKNDMNEQVYADDLFIPMGFDKEDISIFITGYDSKNVYFYDYFGMDKKDIENERRSSKHICPFCSTPVRKLDDNTKRVYCDYKGCVKKNQDEKIIVYDMSKKADRETLTNLSDIHKAEDTVRNVVANMLDFITMPQVHTKVMFGDEELRERNEKRAKRGKEPLKNFSVIRVSGSVERYINLLKARFNNDYERARFELDICGHFFRFWKREKWHKIYDFISKCKDDAEIKQKLTRMMRLDDKGLPLENQYIWDSKNKVIMVWKEETKRNEGYPRKTTIRVISE